jgi:hypothetical protein
MVQARPLPAGSYPTGVWPEYAIEGSAELARRRPMAVTEPDIRLARTTVWLQATPDHTIGDLSLTQGRTTTGPGHERRSSRLRGSR